MLLCPRDWFKKPDLFLVSHLLIRILASCPWRQHPANLSSREKTVNHPRLQPRQELIIGSLLHPAPLACWSRIFFTFQSWLLNNNFITWLFNFWQLGFSHGGSIYTMGNGRSYQSGLFGFYFFSESWFISTPLPSPHVKGRKVTETPFRVVTFIS